jgi:predicted DNA-binding transcriptional regulator YafY
LRASPFRTEIEAEWANMLHHQLPRPLVPFESFWTDLEDVFGWLEGRLSAVQLPRAQHGDLDTWQAPAAITSWRQRVPLELLRYAGANRLKVDIDYRAEQGRQGARRVEPYSLRRTKEGHLVLFVANDSGELRSYRVDRIVGIRPTAVPFKPRYRVEF